MSQSISTAVPAVGDAAGPAAPAAAPACATPGAGPVWAASGGVIQVVQRLCLALGHQFGLRLFPN